MDLRDREKKLVFMRENSLLFRILRDRPFNLKGGEGYGVFLRQKFCQKIAWDIFYYNVSLIWAEKYPESVL